MSFLTTAPDEVQAAVRSLSGIRSMLAEVSASAAAPTAGVVAAAEDQVSAQVAAFFGAFGREYQVIDAQAQAFHEQFVNLLNAGAGAYLSTEVANAQQTLLNAVGGPVQGVLGRAGAAATSSGAALGAAAARPAALLDPILGSGTVGGSLIGSLGGGSVSSSINGVVSALEGGSPLSLLSGTGLPNVLGGLPGLQSLESALLPGLLGSGASTGLAAIASPYQALFNHTIANLQTLGNAWLANPAPFLHQVISNQIGYAQTMAAGLQAYVQNLPAELANLPANIQAGVEAFLAFNAVPYIQQIVNNQIAYAHIFATSLQNAAHDFGTGLQALPAAFQSAFEDLVSGDVNGAVSDVAHGFLGLLAPGLNVTATGNPLVAPGLTATVTPTGTFGDLLPILTIPGMEAQNFTNLLPAGSIPAQISQNFTNVIKTLTDTSITAQALVTVTVIGPPPIPPTVIPSLTLTNSVGLPLALALDAAGAPVNGLSAFNASVTAFANAIQTGNLTGAIGTLIDGPAMVTDAFLNGQSSLPLTFGLSGLTASLNIPLDGILVPPTAYSASVTGSLPVVGPVSLTVPVGGTPISGLATGLLIYAPEQLALAITPNT